MATLYINQMPPQTSTFPTLIYAHDLVFIIRDDSRLIRVPSSKRKSSLSKVIAWRMMLRGKCSPGELRQSIYASESIMFSGRQAVGTADC